MKFKSMIKIVTVLVICATIVYESNSYTPPGPDCYKNLPQNCVDIVREAICAGPNGPYEEIIHRCSGPITAILDIQCFIDVLAIDVGKSCNLSRDESVDMAGEIWRYIYDGPGAT